MTFGKKAVLMRGEYTTCREEGVTFVEVIKGPHFGAMFRVESSGYRQINPKCDLTVLEGFDIWRYKLVQGQSYWITWYMR